MGCACPQEVLKEQYDPYTGKHVIHRECCAYQVLVDLGHTHVREVITIPTITWDQGQDEKIAANQAARDKHDELSAAKGQAVADEALGPKPGRLERRMPPQDMMDRMPEESYAKSRPQGGE